MDDLDYDAAIGRLTSEWYRAVLAHLAPQCRLLDIGIGTGAALLANAALIREKALYVTAVDVDAAYVDRCRRAEQGRGTPSAVAWLRCRGPVPGRCVEYSTQFAR